jgi:hypothetical protein
MIQAIPTTQITQLFLLSDFWRLKSVCAEFKIIAICGFWLEYWDGNQRALRVAEQPEAA